MEKSVQSWHRRLVFCHHLITLFARERNSGESVRPICFAAFKLITNSNFVACCTGRSAGFAPLRILSTLVGRFAELVTEVYPVGHQTSLIHKLLLEINSRQSVLAGKLDDPLSLGEKPATSYCHQCVGRDRHRNPRGRWACECEPHLSRRYRHATGLPYRRGRSAHVGRGRQRRH